MSHRVTFRLRLGLEEMDLSEAETVVGRDSGCALTIDDDLVSRRHATFSVTDGGVQVVDLGSRNGTRVNGVLISTVTRLVHGDRVRIGPREIVFVDTEVPGRARQRHPSTRTGKMTTCSACGEPGPAEAPSCSHCGAAQEGPGAT